MNALFRSVFLLSLLLLSLSSSQAVVETQVLAKCPSEPDVVGYYYNNGRVCVRDKQTWNRTLTEPVCPPRYELSTAGWCRRRLHKKVKPTCPTNEHQLYRGNPSKKTPPTCQSPCPPNTKAYNTLCVQPRQTLSPLYMTCPQDDRQHDHRAGAYCCSMTLGNCPRPQCNIGSSSSNNNDSDNQDKDDAIVGRFYYDPQTGLCERQVQTLPRTMVPKMPSVHDPKQRICPQGTVPVRSNTCQAPCPVGYRASKGKCILPYCAFDTNNRDLKMVSCPEGSYALPQAPL